MKNEDPDPKQAILRRFFLLFEEGESADDEEDEKEDEAAGSDGSLPARGVGLAFEDPDRAEGSNGGSKDHEGVPNQTSFAFGAGITENLLRVHHQEEGEVGDRNKAAADHRGRNGESGFGVASPKDGEEATREARETTAEEEESLVVVDVRLGILIRGWATITAEGFLEGEAVHEHEDDDGGDGHPEDADAEDFFRNRFAGKGFEGDGESSGIALGEHVGELPVGLGNF